MAISQPIVPPKKPSGGFSGPSGILLVDWLKWLGILLH